MMCDMIRQGDDLSNQVGGERCINKNLGIFDQLNDLNQTQISDQCRIGLGVSDMLNNKAGMLLPSNQ